MSRKLSFSPSLPRFYKTAIPRETRHDRGEKKTERKLQTKISSPQLKNDAGKESIEYFEYFYENSIINGKDLNI